MSLTNSKEMDGEQTNAERDLAVIEIHLDKPKERNHRRLRPVSRSPYLDVDAVLARSVPKVAGDSNKEQSEKGHKHGSQ